MPNAEAGLTGLRVLVTGATGFIGTPVVDALLARGALVTALCRDAARAAAWARAPPEPMAITSSSDSITSPFPEIINE